jgi:hypothetical protein
MGSRFDSIQNRMVTKVENLYGYLAVWIPSGDPPPGLSATILFKDPTSGKDLSGINEYNPLHILMEYKLNDFAGLRDAANSNTNEVVIIDEEGGPRQYHVRQVNAKYDGKTFIAILEAHEDDLEHGFQYYLNQTL